MMSRSSGNDTNSLAGLADSWSYPPVSIGLWED